MRTQAEINKTLDRIKKSRAKFVEEATKLNLFENYLFATTFERYETQIDIMESLKVEIETEGVTVEKTYRKGEANTYINPAVAEFNKYASAANGSVKALDMFFKPAGGSSSMASDPLLDFINRE